METQRVDDLRMASSDSEQELERVLAGHLAWKGIRFPLYEGENIIGREEVCDVCLDQSSMSSKHAEIILRRGRATVRDLRSVNGTSVEKKPRSGEFKNLTISRNALPIEDGSRIRMGMVTCAFSLLAQPSPGLSFGSSETIHQAPSLQSETQVLPSEGLMGSLTPTGDDDDASDAAPDDVTVGTDDGSLDPTSKLHDYNLGSSSRVIIAVQASAKPMGTGSMELPTQVDGDVGSAAGGDNDGNSDLSQDLMEPIDPSPSAPPRALFAANAVVPSPILVLTAPTPAAPFPAATQTPSASTGKLKSGIARRSTLTDGSMDTDDERAIAVTITPMVATPTTQMPLATTAHRLAPTPAAAAVEPATPDASSPVPPSVSAILSSGAPGSTGKPPVAPKASATKKPKTAAVQGRVRARAGEDGSLGDSEHEKEVVRRADEGEEEPVPTPRVSRGKTKAPTRVPAREQPVDESDEDTPKPRVRATRAQIVQEENEALQDSDEEAKTPKKPPASRARVRRGCTDEVERNTALNAQPGPSLGVAAVAEEAEALFDTPVPTPAAPAPALEVESAKKKRSPVRFQDDLVDTPSATPALEHIPVPIPVAVASAVEETKPKGRTKKVSAKGKAAGEESGEATVARETAPPPAEAPAVEAPVAAVKGRAKKRVLEPAASEAAPTASAPAAKRGRSAATLQPTTDAELVPAPLGTAEAEVRAPELPVVSSEPEPPLLCFTKVEESTYAKQLKRLGLAITADAASASHCVTTSELKRTPKLMIALNSGVRFVVTEQWLLDCAKAGRVLDVVTDPAAMRLAVRTALAAYPQATSAMDPALDGVRRELAAVLEASPYLVRDVEKEKAWQFHLPTTLACTHISHAMRSLRDAGAAAAAGCGVFAGYGVFVTPGVCGKTAPAEDEMIQIIESGGGVWIRSLRDYEAHFLPGPKPAAPAATSRRKKPVNGAPSSADDSQEVLACTKPFRSVLVVSHASVAKKELGREVLQMATSSGALGVYTVELVFQAVLRQSLDLRAHFLEPYQFT